MIEVLSVENMRKSDAYTIEHFTSGRELMMRAAKGVLDAVEWTGPVAIVCGSGNNAGDGYALAVLLSEKKIRSDIFLLSEKFSEDGKFYFDKCMELGIKAIKCYENDEIEGIDRTNETDSIGKMDFSEYGEIVDCIFGTGFRGEAKGIARKAIERINCDRNSAYSGKAGIKVNVISVDINSGLNGDSGMAALDKEPICIKSDLTVSVGSFKPGHFLGMAKDVIVKKVNVDIGIKPLEAPYCLIEEENFRNCLMARKQLSNKGTYGYIALIGGSLRYSGAIRLANLANAAMRAGAGVVKVAVPGSISKYMISEILESTLFPLRDEDGEVKFNPESIEDCDMVDELIRNVKTIAFGMGIGANEDTKAMLRYILENYKGRLIIDADGLTAFSQIAYELETTCEIILTPHIKEFSRLSGKSIEEINQNPIAAAKELAFKLSETIYCATESSKKVVILLKGPTTTITDGEKVNLVNRGCAGMATAGSGDVLSGIMAAVAAWEKDMLKAATMAAYINGKAGELAEAETNSYSMTAGDTARKVAYVMNEMVEKRSGE